MVTFFGKKNTYLIPHNRVQHWMEHVTGIYNPESDNLSRFKPNPFDCLFNIIRPIDKYTQPFFELDVSQCLRFARGKSF